MAAPEAELCSFFEDYEKEGPDAVLPPGVYTLADLRQFGRKKGWCPYFLARHMIAYANVVVYNYQYLLDPKVSSLVSRELERECVVVFDEAHNIDNVCIEALSVNLRQQTLDAAGRNITSPGILVEPAHRRVLVCQPTDETQGRCCFARWRLHGAPAFGTRASAHIARGEFAVLP